MQPLYCWEGVFTAPLYSAFLAAGICLRSSFLAMDIYLDFTSCHNHYRNILDNIKVDLRVAGYHD
jgi:hypothetical protein